MKQDILTTHEVSFRRNMSKIGRSTMPLILHVIVSISLMLKMIVKLVPAVKIRMTNLRTNLTLNVRG